MRHRDDFVKVDSNGNIVGDYSYRDMFGALSKYSVNTGGLPVADGPAAAHLVGNISGAETSNFDVIPINLTAGVTYSFAERATVSGGIEDPFLLLFNTDGSLNRFDDDGGAGRSSLLTFTPTVSGTYYLGAASWVNLLSTGGDSGDYTIDVWTSTQPDAPGTTAGAVALTVGTTTFGQISSASDVDMYQVSLTAGLYHEFRLSGGVAGDGEFGENGSVVAQIDVLDSHGNVVASGLDYESGAGFIAQDSGTYYVRVSSYGATSGGYTIDSSSVDLSTKDPLDSIIWKSAANVEFADTNGDGIGDTGYVYFAGAGENFGLSQDDDGPDGIADSGDEALTSLGWNPYEKGQALMALQEYGDLMGIHWQETTDLAQATFRLITTEDEPYGGKMYPQDPAYGDLAGIGFFNVDSGGWRDFQQSLERGGFSYEVMLHEFGHGLGLAHPHDDGGDSEVMPGVFAPTGSYGVYNLAQGVYTVMTYNDGWDFHPDGPSAFTISGIDNGWSTLGAFDVEAMRLRYGIVSDYHSGNDVYALTDVVDDAFYQTIYDTGGDDTISYSGALDAQIDLTAATLDYSPTGGGVVSFLHNAIPLVPNSQRVRGGYTIANDVVIENATGGSGNDLLLGNDSVNVLTGNNGNDVLMGRLGDDALIGGAGSDTAAYNDAAASVSVNLATQSASGADGNDTFTSVENAIGSSFNDSLLGDGNANVLDGGLGNDSIDGGGGADTASYASVSTGVTVNLGIQGSAQNTGGGGSDTLNSIENLTGSQFNDRLIGNNGVNVMRGGDGFDVLTLGGGNDRFVAEVGNSKVDLKSGTMSVDILTDFDQNGNDVIDLSGLGHFSFKGSASNKGAGTVTYKTYTSVTGAEHALGIDIHGHDGAGGIGGPVTVVYGDVNGGGADFAIILLNQSSVDANDFMLG